MNHKVDTIFIQPFPGIHQWRVIIIIFADARCFDPTEKLPAQGAIFKSLRNKYSTLSPYLEKIEVSKSFILAPIRSSDCDPSIMHIFIVDSYVSSIPRP